MIAPDANLLIYAYTPKDPNHRTSRAWLEGILSGTEPVGLPILSIQAFMRVQTHPRAAIPFKQAAAAVDSWLALSHVRILYPGDRHWLIYKQLCSSIRTGGAQLIDAAVAAIAIEYGAVVHTSDSDFARFHGVRWHNPLEA